MAELSNANKHRVTVGINDLHITHSHISKFLHNESDGYKYSFGSEVKVDWECSNCGEIIKQKKICEVVKYNRTVCKACSDGFSLPNKVMYSMLRQLNVEFISEYNKDWCKIEFNNRTRRVYYDFYFNYNNQNYLVEMDGDWHKKDNNLSGQTKEQSQYIDSQKDLLAINNNYNIIRIDCFGCTYEIIKSAIINSELKDILKLSLIDWDDIYTRVMKSIVYDICEAFNVESISTTRLSERFGLTRQTILKYLKQGTKIGICNYNPNTEIEKRESNKCIPVVCATTNKIYSSIKEAAINISNDVKNINKVEARISQVCRGIREYCGKDILTGQKLIWRYLDYNNQIIDVVYKRKSESQRRNYPMGTQRSNTTKVVCINTKTIFKSIVEAERTYKIKSLPMGELISSKKKSSGRHPITNEKLFWDYYDPVKHKDFKIYDNSCVA